MELKLSREEQESLESKHRRERDGRVRDRIKAVLLCAEGWSQIQIAQALRIHVETVRGHLADYIASQKLKPENGGSASNLNEEQTKELIKHLETNTYIKVSSICLYVTSTYKVEYTVSGMTKWLHANKFSYKKPKGIPAKANPEEQEKFISEYETLMNTAGEDEPILFADAVHPTMATKISYGWIKKGEDKPIGTTGSRTRINLVGAIDLERMKIVAKEYETVNGEAMSAYMLEVRNTYPTATKIHMILDQGPANTAQETKVAAEKHGIVLHYLPTYSPNLNPVERVWKVMNEYARNNRFFTSAKEFREAISYFFGVTWPQIAMLMIDRINDNFQRLQPVSSG
jgi:transposase